MSVERQFVTGYYDNKIIRNSEEEATDIDWINKRVLKLGALLSDIDQWIYLREDKALTSLERAHKETFHPTNRLSPIDRHCISSALLVCSKPELIDALIEVLKEVHDFVPESNIDDSLPESDPDPIAFDRD